MPGNTVLLYPDYLVTVSNQKLNGRSEDNPSRQTWQRRENRLCQFCQHQQEEERATLPATLQSVGRHRNQGLTTRIKLKQQQFNSLSDQNNSIFTWRKTDITLL